MQAKPRQFEDSPGLPILKVFRLIAVAGWLGLLLAVPVVTDAGIDFLVFVFLWSVGPMLPIVYFVAALISHRDFLTVRGCILWLGPPAAGGLIIVLSATGYPLAVRVWLSERSLLAHAADVAAGVTDGNEPQCVGLFHVRETWSRKGADFFYTRSGWLDKEGIAHIPPGTPPISRIRATHLTGDWYRFTWRF